MDLKGYKAFNEARRHKKGGRNRGNQRFQQQQQNWKAEVPRFNTVEPRGMPMTFSERFKYVLTKMSKTGDKIAKELLELPNKVDARFEYSYLDLTGRVDNMSYLPNGARDIPEEDRYKSNKRQQSKVYKTIKTIFGSKYTKNEVTKFVSRYKEVYNQGPDKKDTSKPQQTDEQILKKIIEDTKNGKLVWEKEDSASNMNRYEVKVPITEKKRLVFCFFHFYQSIKNESMSFVTINLYNDLGKTTDDKRKWLKTYQFKDCLDFLKVFKDKYKINVEA